MNNPSTGARRPSVAANIVKNVTSNWAGIVVGIVSALILGPMTVKGLGNVYYGIWALLMQSTGYLWLLDFGVRESVIKYVAQYHASDEKDELVATVHTAVSLYSVVSVVAMAAVVALVVALPYVFNIPADAVPTARVTALIVGATIAQGFVFNVFVGVLMGLQRFYVMARMGIGFAVVRGFLTYWLLASGYGVIGLSVLHLVMTLAFNLLVYRLCVRELPYLSVRLVRPTREISSRLLNYGKYTLITNLGDKIMVASDAVIIGAFLPIASLAYFAIAGSLIEFFRSFISSMGLILNPLSSSLESRQETRAVGQVFLTSAKAAMALGLPVCTGFIILGSRFINLWMGPEYGAKSGQILAVLAGGHLLGLPYYTISGVLHGLGRNRFVAQFRIVEGVAKIVLSVLLVTKFGLLGVALGTIIPHIIVVGVLFPRVLPSVLPFTLSEYYRSTYVRPIAASLPFWVVCWAIEHVIAPGSLVSLGVWGSVGLLGYVVPFWFFGLTGAERAYVQRYFALRAAKARSAAAGTPTATDGSIV